MQATIDIHTKQLEKVLAKLLRRTGDMRPALRDMGEIVHRSIEKNFAAGGRPNKWEKSDRVSRKGGQTLTDTARLRRSFTVKVGRHNVSVGTNVEYAAALNFGAKIGPHIIRPKHGKALKIPGIGFVTKVNHPGATIPAREFLMVQEKDWPRMTGAAVRHLMK